MLGTNAVIGWRGPWDFAPWRNAPLMDDVGRVLGVGILGPVAEELLFRGVFYAWLIRARVRTVPTVMVLAAVWSVAHLAYAPGVMGLIFVDGLLLGSARYRTRSLVVPMLMHVMWNLYVIW
jgi:membrane protease YdiL (CAAX protease family)